MNMTLVTRIAFLAAFILFIGTLQAQDDRVYPVTEEMPSMPGCENAGTPTSLERRKCTRDKLDVFIAENLKYPSEAIDAGAEGSAVIEFVVRKDGSVTDMKIIEDPGYGMGDAAMKAVKKLNKMWIPGKDKGEAVSVLMRVPVYFALPKEKTEPPAPAPLPDVYTFAEQMPRYGGCADFEGTKADNCSRDSIVAYLMSEMKYPESAIEGKVQGTVLTSFIVDESGQVSSVKVIEGIGGGCDEEAVRLISGMRQWKPGMQGGKAVKVMMEIPVRFRLPAEKE